MRSIKITTALIGLLALAGCVTPGMFETQPVRVPTPKGDVVCQLYMRNVVAWDHSIDHPRDMDVREADQICVHMGEQDFNHSKGYTPLQ